MGNHAERGKEEGDATKERLELIRAVQKELKYSRFVHTMGVAFTATSLAVVHDVDIHKAETAGILHDCAKYVPVDEMEKICRKAGLPVSPVEHGSSSLLHAKAGSVLARTKYGVHDAEIINAIRYHTTGRPGMTELEKIIFIADYIEPGRDQAPHLPEIRKAAFEDLDKGLLMILKDTLDYLNDSGRNVDDMTQKTYDYYVAEKEEMQRTDV